MRSADTSPDAEKVQLDLLRKAGPTKRAALARSLSCTIMWLTRRGIAERYPEADETEVELRFVAACYGEDLANALRQHLTRLAQVG